MNTSIIKNFLITRLITRFGMSRILAVTAAAIILPYVIKKISGKDIREGKVGALLDKMDLSEYIPFLKNLKGSSSAAQQS